MHGDETNGIEIVRRIMTRPEVQKSKMWKFNCFTSN